MLNGQHTLPFVPIDLGRSPTCICCLPFCCNSGISCFDICIIQAYVFQRRNYGIQQPFSTTFLNLVNTYKTCFNGERGGLIIKTSKDKFLVLLFRIYRSIDLNCENTFAVLPLTFLFRCHLQCGGLPQSELDHGSASG